MQFQQEHGKMPSRIGQLTKLRKSFLNEELQMPDYCLNDSFLKLHCLVLPTNMFIDPFCLRSVMIWCQWRPLWEVHCHRTSSKLSRVKAILFAISLHGMDTILPEKLHVSACKIQ